MWCRVEEAEARLVLSGSQDQEHVHRWIHSKVLQSWEAEVGTHDTI